MNRFLIACAATLMYVLPASAQQSAVTVIVHASNSTVSLSTDDVSRMFLKRQTRWPSGAPVVAVDQDARSSARKDFARRFHGRSTTAIENFWQQQIFSGRETPPQVRSSDAAVIAFVADTPGGIAYVSDATRLPAGVRVLQVRNR